MIFESLKRVIAWLLGGFCILFGSIIAGHLEGGLGVSSVGYAFAFLIALMLILIGGLFWVCLAVAAKKE